MRRTVIALAMLTVASPLLAQAKQAADNDPTRKVAGGKTPAGWAIRLDDKDKGRFTEADTKFESMGGGYHVTSGPAALYYSKEAQTNEPFTLSATFTQTKAPQHPEAYGLFITGRDLESADKQTYVYFLVRGDGQYFIAHRGGAERHIVMPWTAHEAITRQDESGTATNALVVNVAADSVRFLVNGKQVYSASRDHMTDVSGQTGIRVNHNLDVHVANLAVKAGAK